MTRATPELDLSLTDVVISSLLMSMRRSMRAPPTERTHLVALPAMDATSTSTHRPTRSQNTDLETINTDRTVPIMDTVVPMEALTVVPDPTAVHMLVATVATTSLPRVATVATRSLPRVDTVATTSLPRVAMVTTRSLLRVATVATVATRSLPRVATVAGHPSPRRRSQSTSTRSHMAATTHTSQRPSTTHGAATVTTSPTGNLTLRHRKVCTKAQPTASAHRNLTQSTLSKTQATVPSPTTQVVTTWLDLPVSRASATSAVTRIDVASTM